MKWYFGLPDSNLAFRRRSFVVLVGNFKGVIHACALIAVISVCALITWGSLCCQYCLGYSCCSCLLVTLGITLLLSLLLSRIKYICWAYSSVISLFSSYQIIFAFSSSLFAFLHTCCCASLVAPSSSPHYSTGSHWKQCRIWCIFLFWLPFT